MKAFIIFAIFLQLLALSALATSQDLAKELEQDLAAKRPTTAADYKVDVPEHAEVPFTPRKRCPSASTLI